MSGTNVEYSGAYPLGSDIPEEIVHQVSDDVADVEAAAVDAVQKLFNDNAGDIALFSDEAFESTYLVKTSAGL